MRRPDSPRRPPTRSTACTPSESGGQAGAGGSVSHGAGAFGARAAHFLIDAPVGGEVRCMSFELGMATPSCGGGRGREGGGAGAG